MDRSAARMLADRRRGLVEGAIAATQSEPPDYPLARKLVEEARTVEDLQKAGADHRNRDVARIVAFACIAVFLVALGFAIHVGGSSLSLQAKADELTFVVRPGARLKVPQPDLASVRAAAVVVDGKREMTPDLSGMTALTEMRALGPRTAITVRKSNGSCFTLLAPSGALELVVGGLVAKLPQSRTIGLDPDGSVELCPDAPLKLVASPASEVRLAAVWEDTAPPTFLPSIRAGVLEFPTTGINRQLTSGQRIALNDARGDLQLELGDAMTVAFSGEAGTIEQFSGFGPETGGATLRPTLAEAALSSPVVRTMTAALAGVWGFLWSLSRLLAKP